MSEAKRSTRRGRSPADLVEEVLDHALDVGLAELSLRSAAAAAGTSHKVLLHHFGTREAFLVAVLRRVRRQMLDDVRTNDVADPVETLRRAWAWYAEHPRHDRLLAQGLGLGLFDAAGTGELAADSVRQHVVESGAVGDPARRLVVAAMRGLLIDRVATGDVEGTDAAFERLLGLVRGGLLDEVPTPG